MLGSGLRQLNGAGTCQHTTRTKAINPLHVHVPLDENSKSNTTKVIAMAVNCNQIHHSVAVHSRRSLRGPDCKAALDAFLKLCMLPASALQNFQASFACVAL